MAAFVYVTFLTLCGASQGWATVHSQRPSEPSMSSSVGNSSKNADVVLLQRKAIALARSSSVAPDPNHIEQHTGLAADRTDLDDGMGCNTILSREDCCKYRDNRDWIAVMLGPMADCMPSKPEMDYSPGVCQPFYWIKKNNKTASMDRCYESTPAPTAEPTAEPTPEPTPEGGMGGDPHAWYNGTKTSFHLPVDHFIQLFEQGDVAIYGQGGPEAGMKQNFLYNMSVRIHDKEVVCVNQRRGNLGKENQSLVEIVVDGVKHDGRARFTAAAADGALEITAKRDSVTITHTASGLSFTAGSTNTRRSSARLLDSHHLNLWFKSGLDTSGGSMKGALPQMWGFEPLSKETAQLVVEPSKQ